MTITERNQRLYELRRDLEHARMMVEFYKDQIQQVRREYDEQGMDLYTEMFGEAA